MIPELGHFALVLALLLSVAQVVFGLGGAARRNDAWMAAARSAVVGQFMFVAIAFAVLAWNVASARSQHARARERALQRAAAGKGAR